MSTAEDVRELVESSPVRAFICAAEVPGSRRAVECEMSRLVAGGELIRARKGLYWKGPKTRVGMPLPRPIDVALEVAGIGSGPAGPSAAHALGLTTQVPSTEVIAVPGRAPKPVQGTRFVSRSIERRFLGLRTTEVALIEVLRAGPDGIEVPWSRFTQVARRLAETGEIRSDVIGAQVLHEHHVATRQRWSKLGLAEPTAS